MNMWLRKEFWYGYEPGYLKFCVDDEEDGHSEMQIYVNYDYDEKKDLYKNMELSLYSYSHDEQILDLKFNDESEFINAFLEIIKSLKLEKRKVGKFTFAEYIILEYNKKQYEYETDPNKYGFDD